MSDDEEHLWARRPHGRHADLYDAEYAKQLERMTRIRNQVRASLPEAAAGCDTRVAAAKEVMRRSTSGGRGAAGATRWDAAPVDLPPATARVAAAPATDRRVRRLVVVEPADEVTLVTVDDDAGDTARPAGTGRRREWLLAGASLLVVLGGVAAALLLPGGPGPSAPTVFHVPGQPTGLVASRGQVWVAGPAAGAVWVLDQASGKPAAPTLRIGGTPARLALASRFAWIADTERSSVVRAPRAGRGALKTIRTGPDLSDVAVAGGMVWTASSADGTVRTLEASGRRRVLHVGARPIALAGDGRRVLVLDAAGALYRLDATSGRPDGPPIALGGMPVDVALAGDYAWVADARAGTVRAVTLTTGLAGTAVTVGGSPVAIAADAGGVYVLCRSDRTLVRLDGAGGIRSRLVLQHAPTALALDSRHVWIAAGTNEVIRVDR